MNSNDINSGRGIFSESDAERIVWQVAKIILDAWPDLGRPQSCIVRDALVVLFNGREHVEARIEGAEEESGVIYVDVDITPQQTHFDVSSFADVLERLGGRWRWLRAEKSDPPCIRMFTRLDSATHGMLQEGVFFSDMGALRQWAEAVSPLKKVARFDEAALRHAYKSFDRVMQPVLPWAHDGVDVRELVNWAASVYELLASGFPVGVTGESPAERRLALTLLAEHCLAEGSSLGWLALAGIDAPKLLSLTKQAPGFVAIPARAMEMNTNPYERGDAVRNLLQTLSDEHSPCVFEGSYAALQALFHGGQGADNDPLNPVVCRIPEIPLETLARFTLWDLSQRRSLPLPLDMAAAAAQVCRALEKSTSAARRLILPVAYRVLCPPAAGGSADSAAFADRLRARTETFGAIGVRARFSRNPETQQRFQSKLTDRGFIIHLSERLFGQDDALLAYVARLQEEVLTRPLHQPLAIALQGTPGTGKSESLALTAKWLGIPHVVIDVASIPDPYTGMAQLLGSGRGIVGSHQAGRLEQVAKHHLGAVVEIADIDHATPAVRSAIGDVFLQILQNGEAQSSIGNMFSCANLILGFSLNLPGGKDERAYQRIGFGNDPTMEDIRRDVQKEIKNMVSGAFLSRLGEPVLFAPLSDAAKIAIVRLALRDAMLTGLERLGLGGIAVSVDDAAAEGLSCGGNASAVTFGARGLVDMARSQVVKVLLDAHTGGRLALAQALRIVPEGQNGIALMVDPNTVIEQAIL